MSKKKKHEIETDLRSLLPEEVQECARQLAGLIEAHKAIKTKAKVAARDFKTQLEVNEEEQERLSRMVITQQEEVPLQRQLTLAEIEDQRRHELSLEEFKQETEAFKGNGDHSSPEVASNPEPGTCRVCGCTNDNACVDGNETCSLFEGQTICTHCQREEADKFDPEIHTTLGEAAETELAKLEAPDGNTIEGGLYRALGGERDIGGIWRGLRERGATDSEIKATISRIFGISGGSGGPDLKSISYKGGKEPAFWFDSSPPAKPTLKGKALIEKAREVLDIPQPAAKAIRNLDAALRDEFGRNWSSLSDVQLAGWVKELRGMKGDTAKEWLKRVEIEMELRDSIGELESNKEFELPVEIKQPRSTYEDALRMAEIVKAEQQRRAAAGNAEKSDVVEADPLDLAPDDSHERTWNNLSDLELSEWRTKLHGNRASQVLAKEYGRAHVAEWTKRVDAEYYRRDETWSKADAQEDDSAPVYGSKRDREEFTASLPGRSDSELVKLQIQCGKEGPENPYYQAVLTERLRRQEKADAVGGD